MWQDPAGDMGPGDTYESRLARSIRLAPGMGLADIIAAIEAQGRYDGFEVMRSGHFTHAFDRRLRFDSLCACNRDVVGAVPTHEWDAKMFGPTARGYGWDVGEAADNARRATMIVIHGAHREDGLRNGFYF